MSFDIFFWKRYLLLFLEVGSVLVGVIDNVLSCVRCLFVGSQSLCRGSLDRRGTRTLAKSFTHGSYNFAYNGKKIFLRCFCGSTMVPELHVLGRD